MKIVKLKGGLGNQLFQYSYAKLIESISGDSVKIDLSNYNYLTNDSIRRPRVENFNISLEIASNDDLRQVLKLKHKGNPLSIAYKCKVSAEETLNKQYYREKNRAYIEPNSIIENNYFDGYWQSWRYVDEVYPMIKRELTPKRSVSEKTLQFMKTMNNENAVFVGVRRGDYQKQARHYGSFDRDYYIRAMEMIEEHIDNPVYYMFSNDIDWCKTNLSFKNRIINFREKYMQTDDFEELILMSSCKYAIIVNSTYHWWGAYLIDNPDKIIIGPQRWFSDDKPIDIQKPEWIWI